LETKDNRYLDNEGIIEGRNAVMEALRSGVNIDKIFIAKGEVNSTLKHIAGAARAEGIAVVEIDRRKLDTMSITHSHQGIIARAAFADYVSIDHILDIARQKGEPPLIVVCDEISDPHNLGAIIRTCEATGTHGVIIPKHRSAGLNATVAKASSGAIFHMAVSRVVNITAALKELQKNGVWIYAASPDGDNELWETDFTGPAAFVIGSEGMGISRLVNENCDFRGKIPMNGSLSSLNASVSAAVFLFETRRQRKQL